MKRVLAIFLILSVCLSFTSCEKKFFPVENLMRPPELSGEDRILQDAFEASVSDKENVVMKTPISGKNRSSYILFDIDNDGKEEAIVLYSVPAEGNHVIAELFKYSNGEWTIVSQIECNSDEVYEVDFADINGDDCNEIFISWSGLISESAESDTGYSFNATQTLMVYSYDGSKTNLILTKPYTNLFIKDLNNDKADEILIFKINVSDIINRTTVRIISFNNDYSIQYEDVTNITDMIEIDNIVCDSVVFSDKSVSRIFVDGAVNEFDIITEIIEIDKKTFDINLPLYNDNHTSQPRTLRKEIVYCFDIDKDGCIEIPSTEVFSYAHKISKDNKDIEPINLVVWSEFDKNSFNVKFKCLLNKEFGCLFFIADEFLENISIIYDEENLNLTFYSIDSNGTFKNALFSFRIFTIPDWEKNNFNYEKLHENDTYVYGYLIFRADNYKLYREFITENFYAL